MFWHLLIVSSGLRVVTHMQEPTGGLLLKWFVLKW
jgi:hypothetical protein